MNQNENVNLQIGGVRFHPTGKVYHFAAGDLDLRPGDFVLVDTVRGQQLGQLVSLRPVTDENRRENLKPIRRRATGRDMALRQQWVEKEEQVLAKAREVTAQMDLPVKIVTAEYSFDGKRLTLLYVSEERNLNLRQLQSRLQRTLDNRVELHRIGPRDHAKLLGGYGACGEPRCCARFMADFTPVSIKMAKTQGVSLSPSEITGMCGRLRCCLVFENEQYREACKVMPRRKKRVRTPQGEGKIIDLLPLKGVVVVQIEDRRIEVPAEDVEVIPRK